MQKGIQKRLKERKRRGEEEKKTYFIDFGCKGAGLGSTGVQMHDPGQSPRLDISSSNWVFAQQGKQKVAVKSPQQPPGIPYRTLTRSLLVYRHARCRIQKVHGSKSTRERQVPHRNAGIPRSSMFFWREIWQ